MPEPHLEGCLGGDDPRKERAMVPHSLSLPDGCRAAPALMTVVNQVVSGPEWILISPQRYPEGPGQCGVRRMRGCSAKISTPATAPVGWRHCGLLVWGWPWRLDPPSLLSSSPGPWASTTDVSEPWKFQGRGGRLGQLTSHIPGGWPELARMMGGRFQQQERASLVPEHFFYLCHFC